MHVYKSFLRNLKYAALQSARPRSPIHFRENLNSHGSCILNFMWNIPVGVTIIKSINILSYSQPTFCEQIY